MTQIATVKLPQHSALLQRALRDGALPNEDLPLDTGPGSVTLRALGVTADGQVELAVGAVPGRPATGKVWFEAIRAISLTATATPCIASLLAILLLGLPVAWPIAGLAILGVLLMQISVNLENDVEDYQRLIDVPGTLGGSGVLHKGWLSAAAVQRAARITMVLGLAAGIPTLLRAPGPMAVVAVLAVIGSAGYSGKPFGLKYRALGDLAVILLCGPALTLGFGVAATGALQMALVPLGLAMGLLAVGILHVNNVQDIEADQARDATTLASLMGVRASLVYLVALYVGAALSWVVVTRQLGLGLLPSLIPAIALIPTSKLLNKLLRAPNLHVPELALVRIEAAQLHLAWGVLFIVALGLALGIQ